MHAHTHTQIKPALLAFGRTLI